MDVLPGSLPFERASMPSKGRGGHCVQHPSDEILKLFAKGTTSREEGRAVVAHLLKGCPSCAEKIKTFLQPDPVAGDTHEAVLKRFEDGLAARLERLQESEPPKPGAPPEQPSPRPPKGKGKGH
jgi:hypothetical protein